MDGPIEYWCVAMDNRGYGESDKPKHQRNYSVDKLADDVANLAKHLGRDKFILVGHDWGGAIGYEERVCFIDIFVPTLILALIFRCAGGTRTWFAPTLCATARTATPCWTR